MSLPINCLHSSLFLLYPSSCVPSLQRSLLAFGPFGLYSSLSRLACATMDALTPATVRFFGRSSRHERRSLPRRQVSHVCRLLVRPPFRHQPPDKPQQLPFPVLCEPR